MNPEQMKAAFPKAIENVANLSDKVVVIVGDIGHFALQGFAKNNPGRYYNLGILEPTLVSTCAGLSKEGLYPIGHTIAPFIAERSLEQIKLDFCYQEIGGNLITVGSAFDYSTLGCTHHSYADLGLISSYPNTEVLYPASPNEMISLLEQRFDSGKLSYFRMARNPHGIDFKEVKFGKNILVSEGSEITLITSGPQLKEIIRTAKLLNNNGISTDILYCHTIKPFDSESLIHSAMKTKRVFIVEEHISSGSLVSNVLDSLRLIPQIKIDYHCIPDKFIRNYGTYEEILYGLNFNAEYFIKKIRNNLL